MVVKIKMLCMLTEFLITCTYLSTFTSTYEKHLTQISIELYLTVGVSSDTKVCKKFNYVLN